MTARTSRPVASVVVTTLGAALLLGSCTSDPAAPGTPAASSGPAPTSTAPTPPDPGLELRSRVTRVAGRLPDRRRERLERQTRTLVRDYLEAAFLGDYPGRGTARRSPASPPTYAGRRGGTAPS